MLQKDQKILSEINEKKPGIHKKQVLYQRMIDELKQFGYSEFRYAGEGSQGQVVLAKETLTNIRFAIKGIKVSDKNGNINQKDLDNAMQEKNILQKCAGSPYVSNLIKSKQGTEFVFLFLTECIGNLQELIDSLQGKKLNEISAIKYFKDIAEGLHYIHSKECIVNDIKFDNILIDYNGNAVISDFGCGQTLPKKSEYSLDEYKGNTYFQAPECYVTQNQNYIDEYQKRNVQTQTKPSIRSDSYSLGLILYTMVQGHDNELTQQKHEQLIYDQNFENFKYKNELKQIIDGLTQFVPRQRLALEEVLVLLKKISSFEFDLDQNFVELVSQETKEQAKQLYPEIEFIQNFNNKYYPIFKNESSILQKLEFSQDEIQKIIDRSKHFQDQINSLKALQVQAESKIKEQEKTINERNIKMAQLNQTIQYYQDIQCKCKEKEEIKCSKCGYQFSGKHKEYLKCGDEVEAEEAELSHQLSWCVELQERQEQEEREKQERPQLLQKRQLLQQQLQQLQEQEIPQEKVERKKQIQLKPIKEEEEDNDQDQQKERPFQQQQKPQKLLKQKQEQEFRKEQKEYLQPKPQPQKLEQTKQQPKYEIYLPKYETQKYETQKYETQKYQLQFRQKYETRPKYQLEPQLDKYQLQFRQKIYQYETRPKYQLEPQLDKYQLQFRQKYETIPKYQFEPQLQFRKEDKQLDQYTQREEKEQFEKK